MSDEPANAPGKNYFYYIDQKTRAKQIAGVGVHTTIAFDFRFEPLDWFDKLAAKLGFASPILSGDPAFDAKVYTYSTNAFLYQLLSINSVLRQTILAIFQSGVTSLVCEKGQLIAISGRVGNKYGWEQEDEVADILGEQLQSCLRHIAPIQVDAGDTTFRRAAALDRALKTVLISGLAIAIVTAWIIGFAYQLITLLPLIHLTIYYSVPAMCALLLLIRTVMSGTPYGSDAFRNFIKFGPVAIIAATYSGLYHADVFLDSGPAEEHVQKITAKHYSGSRHHTYYLTVNDLHDAGGFDVSVSRTLYDRSTPGQSLRILSHPGFFNIEWISVP